MTEEAKYKKEIQNRKKEFDNKKVEIRKIRHLVIKTVN